MKQQFNAKTLSAYALLVSLLLNIAAPCLLAAEISEPSSIKIAHFPNKVGKHGSRIAFRVHVADDVDLQQVMLVIIDGDKPVRGKMTELIEEGNVPVLVRTRVTAPIYTSAKTSSKSKTSLPAGETLDVSQAVDSFLRVVSPSGKKGFVLAEDVDVISLGRAFSVTLPASMTQRSKLTYRFEASGFGSAKGTTESVTMRLLTTDEIEKLLEQYRAAGKLPKPKGESNIAQKSSTPQKSGVKTSKPTVKGPSKPAVKTAARQPSRSSGANRNKTVLWGGIVAAGGIAYYMLKDRVDQENLATLNVVVDWE